MQTPLHPVQTSWCTSHWKTPTRSRDEHFVNIFSFDFELWSRPRVDQGEQQCLRLPNIPNISSRRLPFACCVVKAIQVGPYLQTFWKFVPSSERKPIFSGFSPWHVNHRKCRRCQLTSTVTSLSFWELPPIWASRGFLRVSWNPLSRVHCSRRTISSYLISSHLTSSELNWTGQRTLSARFRSIVQFRWNDAMIDVNRPLTQTPMVRSVVNLLYNNNLFN